MSQEPYNKDEKRAPRFNNRPGPGDDPNQPPRKGPRFSIYWIYAIIFAVLIGFQLFGGIWSPNMAKISELEFQNLVANGDVAKYTIVDNRKTVKVFLTADGKKRNDKKLKEGVTGKVAAKELFHAAPKACCR